MSKSKHSEAQIIAALKLVEAGRAVEDLAREYGVSKHTVYAWKAKYGGMDVSEAQEVKQLREENARMKKLLDGSSCRHRSIWVPISITWRDGRQKVLSTSTALRCKYPKIISATLPSLFDFTAVSVSWPT